MYRISYYKREFETSLALADSALVEIFDKAGTADYSNIEIIKGLYLLHLHKRKEGFNLIRKNMKLDASYNGINLCYVSQNQLFRIAINNFGLKNIHTVVSRTV